VVDQAGVHLLNAHGSPHACIHVLVHVPLLDGDGGFGDIRMCGIDCGSARIIEVLKLILL